MCKGRHITMDWDLELSNFNNENMIIVYEQEIEQLKIEKNELEREILFLKRRLEIEDEDVES